MSEWIISVLNSDQAGIIILAAVFLLGIISVFTCTCNFVIIGAMAGYSGSLKETGKTKTILASSLFLLLSNVVVMSAIGCLIGYASGFVGAAMGNYWKIAMGIILILFGIYILDILPFKIKSISPNIQNTKSGMAGAILFGLVMGSITPLAGLCCNPIFPIVAAASFVKGSMLWGFLLLFFFAFGHGITLAAAMLGVGLGVGKIATMLTKFATVIKYIGGITLIILGFYFLLTI
ncbi:MAG: hypothetical protein LBH91_09210 [Prevotellaceae bacterium]|jgi:cytochrome c biogenesis protein CcdA|nr:hypothetical protein [Prevotellaceae bacterium]